MDSGLVSMEEAAELLHVHVRTVYRMQDRGDLPTLYLGRVGTRAGRRLVKRSAIEAYIEAAEAPYEVPAIIEPPPERKAKAKAKAR